MGVIQDGASNKKTNNTKREWRKRTTTATIGGRFLWACVINVVRRDSIWYDFILGKFLILLSKDWTQKCWANMFSLLNERCILTATLEQPRQATTNLLLSLPIKTSVYLLGAALRFLPLPSSLFPGKMWHVVWSWHFYWLLLQQSLFSWILQFIWAMFIFW